MSEEPLELDPLDLPDPPDLPGRVCVEASAEEVMDVLIAKLLEVAEAALEDHGRFDLAVSGDDRLQPLWRQMMMDPDLRGFPWERTHLWFTNATPTSCERLAETLIWPAGIPMEQVHPMPAAGSEVYAQRLRDSLEDRPLDAAVVSSQVQCGVRDDDDQPSLDMDASFQSDCTFFAILAIGCGVSIALSPPLAAALGKRLHWYLDPLAAKPPPATSDIA